jgi:hypothetical protein
MQLYCVRSLEVHSSGWAIFEAAHPRNEYLITANISEFAQEPLELFNGFRTVRKKLLGKIQKLEL